MPLGREVDLDPGHIVLDGDPAPPGKGHQPPLFGPCLLWPNGRPFQLLLSIVGLTVVIVTDIQTDRQRYSVYRNRPHLPSTAIRPNNI